VLPHHKKKESSELAYISVDFPIECKLRVFQMVIEQTRQSVSFSAHFSAHNKQKSLSQKIG